MLVRFEDPTAANQAFYKAMSTADIELMSSVWARREADTCIHPGWPMLTGWDAIRQSVEAIFAGSAYMHFSISDEQVEQWDGVARVNCIENIWSVAPGRTVQTRVAATNLFVLTGEGWRMILHHGSPIAGSNASQQIQDATD